MKRFFLIVLLLFAGGAIIGILTGGQPPKPEPASLILDKSSEAQAKRLDLINRLIAEGVFQKIEVPGNLPRLWVTPKFLAIDFDAKQSFVGVVYAYYFDGTDSGDSVRIFDNITGKELGTFTSRGLTLH
jgi:hypothetical protein